MSGGQDWANEQIISARRDRDWRLLDRLAMIRNELDHTTGDERQPLLLEREDLLDQLEKLET